MGCHSERPLLARGISVTHTESRTSHNIVMLSLCYSDALFMFVIPSNRGPHRARFWQDGVVEARDLQLPKQIEFRLPADSHHNHHST
jgi:hypothetical protein